MPATRRRRISAARLRTLRDELEGMLLFLGPSSPRAVPLRHALARLDDGTYGDCLACGGPIEAKRLDIVPEATRCVNCQAEYDVPFAA